MSNPSDAEVLAAHEAAMTHMLRHNIGLVAKELRYDKFMPGEIAVTILHEMETGRQADAALAGIVRNAVRNYIAGTEVYKSALKQELQKWDQ